MRSQTLDQLQRLFRLLPPQRLRAVQALLPFSLLPGAVDLVCVWLIAQLTGSLVRNDLGSLVPGLGAPGSDAVSQSLWMIGLFVLFCWLASAAKLGLRLRQQRLSARIWRDLSDLIYARLLHQPFAFHLETGSAELSSRVLANLNHLAVNVITPMLQLISGLASIASVGWDPLGGTLAVRGPRGWLGAGLHGCFCFCYPSIAPCQRRAGGDGGAIFTAAA